MKGGHLDRTTNRRKKNSGFDVKSLTECRNQNKNSELPGERPKPEV